MVSEPLPAPTGTRRSFRPLASDPALRIPLTYFIVAQLLDTLTTLMGMVGGLGELNPVTSGVMARFGTFGLLLQKVPVILLTICAVAILPRRFAVVAGWAFTTVMAAVVAANVGLILSIHRP